MLIVGRADLESLFSSKQHDSWTTSTTSTITDVCVCVCVSMHYLKIGGRLPPVPTIADLDVHYMEM